MERNDFSSDASTQGQPGAAGAAGGSFGSTGTSGSFGTTGSTGSSTASEFGTTDTGDQADASAMTDRARDMAGSAKDKLADVGSSARERAGHLKNSLADALESGADRLRQRAGSSSGQLNAATGSGSVAIEGEGRVTQVTTRVAGGMSATAGWLRDADMDGLKSGLEQQVKEHPGRTLLIAVGMGYLIGKAFRK